ncbi:HAD superfamily hydrolase (TIGR01459 family) [Yoonia maricola]|uniref:HAD superfamily hydrolase (TIGR01459 family) n=1 Tax=Yoonia maricola TaxID=420999 RepID=A0A2M8W0F5_9RHOB|nr:TIGR01459 family HAD-type hydrolase [Yoonia maricola]PJI84408.1 HAD superfamily hydrolase (TIGR01459 family) [Yoonia maricola]
MQQIDSILAIADQYDAIVFDQWGVLHNGTSPYPDAVVTIDALKGKALAVLSNSGKRADVNADRITGMGFAPDAFGIVMTSGEALHLEFGSGRLRDIKTLLPMTAAAGDAAKWAGALPVVFTDTIDQADAVLLMGLPDATEHPKQQAILDRARALKLPLICSNPDHASPRANGKTVQSPGALAHAYADAGGRVMFYGKPHKAIFDVLSDALGRPDPKRVLMVGDSPEHDIAGAQTVGWDSLFIAGGLHADATTNLFAGHPPATYIIPTLR